MNKNEAVLAYVAQCVWEYELRVATDGDEVSIYTDGYRTDHYWTGTELVLVGD